MGKNIGKSLYEEDYIELAKTIIKNKNFLPSYVVVTKGRDSALEEKHIDLVDDDDIIFDVGQTSIEDFSQHINSAKTIIWNGPMGYFEGAVCSRYSRNSYQNF